MKVLILEDVIEHQVRLERILDEISKESNIPISYKTTGKVREFEEYIENDEVNQLYFLDIDIHGIEKKGFEVAQLIRHYNPYAIIVFITSRSEFATIPHTIHTTNPIVHTGLPLNARNNVTIIAIPVTGLKIAMITDKYLFSRPTIPNP